MSSGNRPRSSEYGEAASEGDLPLEIAETLWLWEKVDGATGGGRGETTPEQGQSPQRPDEPRRDPNLPDAPADPIHPTRSPGTAGRVEVDLTLEAGPGVGKQRGGARRYEAHAETDPAVADPLSFHRALRPLHLLVASPDRWELDEDATAERLARDELGVPVRRPETEPRYEIHLVVDDSPSMTLWLDVVPGLVNLLEQSRLRDVRVSYLDATSTRPDGVVLRSTRKGGSAPQPATSFNDPSGRRIVWILSDTLAPAWRADAVAPALHLWARSGPVALINFLPERMWRCGGVSFHPVRMVPPQGGSGGTTPRWTFSRPWGRQVSGMSADELARVTPVPMVELSQHWLAPWAEMVGAEPARLTEMTAVLTGQVQRPRRGESSTSRPSARERVGRFRHLASPTAFDLATHLAAAPLTWPVLRLVLDMVPAAGREHLSEVFAAGVVVPTRHRRRDDPTSDDPTGDDPTGSRPRHDIALEFEPGVREELLAYGSRSAALRVLRAAAGALGDEVDALRDLDAVLTAERPENVSVPVVTDVNRPFLAVEETVLASVSGRFLRRSRRLGSLIGSLPSTNVAGPARGNTAVSVRGVTMSSETKGGRTPTPRPDPDSTPAPGRLAAGPGAPERGGTEFVTSSTAAPLVESRRAGSGWPAILGGALPQRNPHFTGRTELLRELHRRLGEGATAVLPEALHGMGGVGKSQLAVEYVYRYQSAYELIWWIPAERNAQIVQALVDLAPALRPDVGSEANTALPAVREALRLGKPHGRWLLVFDNAEDPNTILDYFPASGAEGRVLVTSRDARWANVARPLEVAVFARSESKELLQRRSETLSDTEADRLAAALGDLPLAIEQAAMWRVETGMPADEYLDLLETKLSELFAVEPSESDSPAGRRSEQSVTAAWSVSLDRLAEKNPAALRLLQVCAFFAPERISRQLFTRARSTMIVPELDAALRDPITLGRAIREVTRYSLMKIDHRSNSFQMHRLVQKVLIDRMTLDERETMRRGAHALLAASDPADPTSRENWLRYGELYPHVLASDVVKSQDPWVRDLLLNEVKYLYQWGEHEAARGLAQQAYDVWSEMLGPEHRQTLDIGGWLSFVLFVVGRFRQAAALNTELLETCSRVLGDDHEVTLETLGAVAADKRVEGDYAAALTLSQQVYERSVRTLGADEPQTLEAAHNVCVSLRLLGRFAAARELAEDTLERRELQFGVDATPSLLSRSGINSDRRELGEYLEARYQQEQLLVRLRLEFGDNESHPQFLKANRSLSVARRKAGDHAEALAVSRDVQIRFATRYDLDYPDTLAASLCLSMDLRHAGNLSEARELCDDTLTRYRAVLGEHHPHAFAAEVNLAVTHRLAGDVTKAHEIDTRAAAGLRDALGEEHPSYLVSMTNLASDHYALGEFQTAHTIDLDVVARSTRVLGERHPATLAAQANLAMDLRALRRTAEAEQLHTATVSHMDTVLGVDHPATRNAAGWVRSDCDIDPMPL